MRTVEIRIRGCLDQGWSTWFEGFEFTALEVDETGLAGPVPDQAAMIFLGSLGFPVEVTSSPRQFPKTLF